MRNPHPHRRPLLLGVSMAVALSLAPVTATPATGARAVPNLVVGSASVDRTTVAEGAVLRVTHTVRNTGTARAAASETRFYLTTDVAASNAARKASRTHPRSAPQDVRLIGGSRVKELAGGRSVSLSAVKVTVPVGTAAGRYSLLACTDDRGRVREKSEVDNCTVAASGLKVAAAEGSDSLVLQTFADSSVWPPDEKLSVQMMKIFCGMVTPAKAMTLKTALTSASAFLQTQVGAGAMDKLRTSGTADTVVEAQQLAGVAVAKGTPGLALAALLRARGLEPKNGTHLINAAALATGVGLPNEALALLDAAQALDVRRPAFGISQHAIALTVRGQALLMTGRPAQAELMFKAAKTAEPLLSEADAGLATVEACKGNDGRAARYVRKSRQREQEKDTTEPDEEVERPEPALDRSFGKETPLRQLPMAETPAQGVVMQEVYEGILRELQAEGDEQQAENTALWQHLDSTDAARTEAEKNRRNGIWTMAWAVDSDPDIVALQGEFDDKFHLIREHEWEFFPSGTGEAPTTYTRLMDEAVDACAAREDEDFETCYLREMNSTCRPALTAAHTQWRGMMSELQTLANQLIALESKRMSAYASNLLDAKAHRLVTLSIEESESGLYKLLVTLARSWTVNEKFYEQECVAPLPAEVLTPAEPTPAQTSGPCPTEIAAMNAVASLGPSKVKVTCEKVSQEISAEVLPLLHAFGEVSYDFRTGKMTLFAGSKGEGKLGVVEAGFKSGIYLTTNGRGGIEDVGWRVGPGVSVGEGAAEFSAHEDMIDLSFVGALTTGP